MRSGKLNWKVEDIPFEFTITVTVSGVIRKEVVRYEDTGKEVPPDVHLSAEVDYDRDKIEKAIEKECLSKFGQIVGGKIDYVGGRLMVGFPDILRGGKYKWFSELSKAVEKGSR